MFGTAISRFTDVRLKTNSNNSYSILKQLYLDKQELSI